MGAQRCYVFKYITRKVVDCLVGFDSLDKLRLDAKQELSSSCIRITLISNFYEDLKSYVDNQHFMQLSQILQYNFFLGNWE